MNHAIYLLDEKVKLGLACHVEHGGCTKCPYNDGSTIKLGCSERLSRDARTVIDYWRDKYEQTITQQPMMILHNPEPMRIEPVDVKATLKVIKTMNNMDNAAKRATDALDEARMAIRALKKELNEFDKK